MTFNFFDFAYAATHLGILPTTEEQLALDQQFTAAFNTEAAIRGWPVRVEQFGPALPDLLYIWDKKLKKFVPAPRGAQPCSGALAEAGDDTIAQHRISDGGSPPCW